VTRDQGPSGGRKTDPPAKKTSRGERLPGNLVAKSRVGRRLDAYEGKWRGGLGEETGRQGR